MKDQGRVITRPKSKQMYNATSIKSGLIGLVGWRQNEDPSGIQLNALTSSSSGLYFNDEHPLLTMDNLISIAPEFARITYTAWDNGANYVIGDKVAVSNVNYICILANTNQTPPNATYWEVYSPFTAWLQERTEAGIIRGLQAWIDKKFKQRTVNGLLERSNLFNAAGYAPEKDVDQSKVVGLEILPTYSKDVLTEIKKVGLQFDTDQTITVYLFSSRSATPIQTEAFAYTGAGGLQWFTPSSSWSLASEGAYYLVYDQDAITGQSINGVHNYAQLYSGRTSYARSKFFNASSFSVDGTVAGLWNTSSNAYTLSTNYGLNVDFSVGCDYTNLFVEQKNEFKTIIAKQVAADLLREMAYNPNVRVNRNESNANRTEVLYEIDGDTQGRDPGNMRKQLEDAINSASMDTTGIDKVCLPCRKRAATWRIA